MKGNKNILKTATEKINSTILAKTFSAVLKNKLNFSIMVVADLLFMLALYLLNKFMTWLFPSISIGSSPNNTTVVLLFSILIYYTLTIFAYSGIKFVIIKKISYIFDKNKLQNNSFDRFIILNIILTVMLILVFAVFSAVFIFTINVDILSTIRDAFLVFFFTLSYIFMNIAHSNFINYQKIKKTLSTTFDVLFTRPLAYIPVIISTLIISTLLIAAYYALDWTVLKLIGSTLNSSVTFTAYAIFNTVIIAIGILFVISFNRIYFYKLIKKVE